MSRVPRSFKIFQTFISTIPLSWHYKIASLLAHIAYLIDRRHTKIAFVNLDIAFGNRKTKKEKRKIVIESYKNLFIVGVETVLLQGISKERLLSMVEFENEEILTDALKSKKAITFFTGHYGNWELGILAVGAKYGSLSVVGRPLDFVWADNILRATREQFGVKLVPKKGAMRTLIKEMRDKKAIGIAVDQNTSSKDGILVNFFDKEARHTPALSILARKFDAIIIPVFDFRVGVGKYKVKFYKPIKVEKSKNVEEDILNITQAQSDLTESVIENRPELWLWLHSRWKNRYRDLYE
jgi:KDO2-lipid IV(A) lauroyltransferase